jgi:hypothetical protein
VDNFLKTVIREPALYMLPTFHVLNLLLIFYHLGRLCKESIQARVSLIRFIMSLFLMVRGC